MRTTKTLSQRLRTRALFFIFFVSVLSVAKAKSPEAPSGLTCELMARTELTAICDPRPEFGWVVNSPLPDDTQSAYQILVASGSATLEKGVGDLWDTGKVASAQQTNVEYAGQPLASNKTYFWKVRTWNGNGEVSTYSQAHTFRTGELSDSYATTRYPLVETQVKPVRVVRKADGYYFIDFGKDAFGTISLTLTSPTAGRQVEIHLGEVPAGEDSINRKPGGARRYRVMTLKLDEGTHTYRVAITPDKRNTGPNAIKMPGYTGEVMPFRYCEVVNSPSALDSSNIRQIAVHYPFDDDA
ncbi:MAG: family 78 glycoside hydrolase catalytic domain, partial [Sedimentisphaerales bacterium]